MAEEKPAAEPEDPFWVDVTEGGVRVIMSAGHAVAYQRWLRARGLHLFKIPSSPEEADDPYYAVGVRDELWDQLVRISPVGGRDAD